MVSLCYFTPGWGLGAPGSPSGHSALAKGSPTPSLVLMKDSRACQYLLELTGKQHLHMKELLEFGFLNELR